MCKKLIEARAARYWNMRPSELRSVNTTEAAELVAIYLVEDLITTYYESEKQRKYDEVGKKSSKPGLIKPGM